MARKTIESANAPAKPPGNTEGLQAFEVAPASQTAVEPHKTNRKGAGRPEEFDRAIIDEIFSRMAEGETLTAICDSDRAKFPKRHTIKSWIAKREELSAEYARVRTLQADAWADEMIGIADDKSRDTKTIETQNGSYDVADKEWIERSKQRIETRKWLMGRLHPKQWGDKIEQTVNGNITTQFTLSVGDGSVQQRQEKPANKITFDLPAKSADEIIEENL
jgi:hypothetical protein